MGNLEAEMGGGGMISKALRSGDRARAESNISRLNRPWAGQLYLYTLQKHAGSLVDFSWD